jgi:phosphoribosylamine-glycine ligase
MRCWAMKDSGGGPDAEPGAIESSKSFARELLAKYKIPGNPFFQRFTSMDGVEECWRGCGRHVIKDDGLAGGKGVKVCGDHLHSLEESWRSAGAGSARASVCDRREAGGRGVFADELLRWEDAATYAAVQDHKRAYEGDKGPNTGGMGTYTDATTSCRSSRERCAEAQAINERVARRWKKNVARRTKEFCMAGLWRLGMACV